MFRIAIEKEGKIRRILGIDASNIRGGGGVTHLVEILRVAEPQRYGFDQVFVWGGSRLLDQIEKRPWLIKSHQKLLDKALPFRLLWQRYRLAKLAEECGCEVLFIPGGSYGGTFRPFVVMSQNMLPFEWREMKRYGPRWMLCRCILLRYAQSRTFRHADGLIFLTHHAKDAVMKVIKTTRGQTRIIPHGVNERFLRPPHKPLPITMSGKNRPFRILYVSMIDMYKHQWYIAEAVASLRRSGLPVVLDLVGGAYPPALKQLHKTMTRLDPEGEYIRYWGEVPYDELHDCYAKANICLFASSCENMPNILLEKMASGKPVACSNHNPMPELLGNAGVYFDPENPAEISSAIKSMIESPEMCARISLTSFERSQDYSWTRCANQTFNFLSEVTHVTQQNKPPS